MSIPPPTRQPFSSSVAWSISQFKFFPPASPGGRVLAVHAGSRTLRLLLAESRSGALRIIKEDFVDLHEEGLVSTNEIKRHWTRGLADGGHQPSAWLRRHHLP